MCHSASPEPQAPVGRFRVAEVDDLDTVQRHQLRTVNVVGQGGEPGRLHGLAVQRESAVLGMGHPDATVQRHDLVPARQVNLPRPVRHPQGTMLRFFDFIVLAHRHLDGGGGNHIPHGGQVECPRLTRYALEADADLRVLQRRTTGRNARAGNLHVQRGRTGTLYDTDGASGQIREGQDVFPERFTRNPDAFQPRAEGNDFVFLVGGLHLLAKRPVTVDEEPGATAQQQHVQVAQRVVVLGVTRRASLRNQAEVVKEVPPPGLRVLLEAQPP